MGRSTVVNQLTTFTILFINLLTIIKEFIMLKVNYVEDTRPIRSIVLSQPKGTLDLTISKNAKGNRLRISNKDGNVVNVATTELASFIDGLNRVSKHGAKVSQRA